MKQIDLFGGEVNFEDLPESQELINKRSSNIKKGDYYGKNRTNK